MDYIERTMQITIMTVIEFTVVICKLQITTVNSITVVICKKPNVKESVEITEIKFSSP